jgi:cell division protein FtsB
MTLGQKVLRFFQSRLARGVILVLSLLAAFGVVRSVVTIWQKRGIVEERVAVLKMEEAKRADLEAKLREATTSAFVERVAREKLGLVREGEKVVIMDRTQSSQSATSKLEHIPTWKQWWQLFF